MTEFFRAYPWVAYVLIFVLITYIYNKVFKTGRLPVLKAALLYLLLAIGSFMLLLFQLEGLPMVASLFVAFLMMVILRVRYFIQDRRNKS